MDPLVSVPRRGVVLCVALCVELCVHKSATCTHSSRPCCCDYHPVSNVQRWITDWIIIPWDNYCTVWFPSATLEPIHTRRVGEHTLYSLIQTIKKVRSLKKAKSKTKKKEGLEIEEDLQRCLVSVAAVNSEIEPKGKGEGRRSEIRRPGDGKKDKVFFDGLIKKLQPRATQSKEWSCVWSLGSDRDTREVGCWDTA